MSSSYMYSIWNWEPCIYHLTLQFPSKDIHELQQTVQRYQDEQLAMKVTLMGMIEANTQLVQLVQSNLGQLDTVSQQQQESLIALDDTVEQLKVQYQAIFPKLHVVQGRK